MIVDAPSVGVFVDFALCPDALSPLPAILAYLPHNTYRSTTTSSAALAYRGGATLNFAMTECSEVRTQK
jgi:hypothetical protein